MNGKISGVPWSVGTWLRLIACFSIVLSVAAGCSPRVVYLKGSQEIIFLEPGAKAPHPGFLVPPETMASIHDHLQILEEKIEDR